MEEYDPADPTEEASHGAAAAAAAASKGEEDRPTEDRPEGPPKSETSDKPEINLADFPTQFGKPAKKRTDKSYFHEGMADLPSRYDDEEEEGGRRRWRRGDDSDEEKRFEEEYDNDNDRRFGRGRGRGGRFSRPPRRFEDDDEFGRDGPPRIEDNPFRRLEQDGPGRPPPGRDRPPPRDRYSRDDDRPPYDDDPRYDHRRFRRSPPPFDDRDDRHPRFRRDGPGPPYDGPPYDGPPYDRPPYDDDRYDRPPRFGPPRYDRDGPPMYDRDGPPPPGYDDDRHHYDRFHFHRDRPPRYGPPPRPDSPDFGPPMHPGPPGPPRPRGGLLPTPPPPSQQPSEPQYPPPPPEHGMPFPGPEGPPRFGPPPPGPPPPPMGPPPFQGPPMPFQGPPGFPAPPQHMPGPMPGMPPPGPEMPPMSAEQQYYGPPPPMMPPQGDPQWGQQMMAPPMQGMPPPPPPQFPPPPPPMDPSMGFPPMDPQMMQPPMMPPQPPMAQPQQYYEQAPPPQMMVFPPPPPPPEPVEIPEPKPELIPIPPPPAEEEQKSDDMEIDNTEMPDVPTVPEKPQDEDQQYKMMYSAEPTVPVSIEPPVSSATIVSAPVSYSAPPTYSAAPALAPVQKMFEAPKFAAAPTMADSRPPPPPPPMVVFPTHIYSAPQTTQVSEEDKSVAQKAAEDLMMMTQATPQQVTMPIVHPVVQPEPEPVVQDQPRGFVPVPTVETEPVKEPVSYQKEEPEPEPMERETTPEKQSGDPIKTTAQQLLERIKQKQLKAQASSLQGGGSNPLVKSARRFFNPVAMVAGSKIQFAMATAKKSVTADNPLKSQEEDADKKKKGKEGKKEMFRPGLDGEETLSSIMQKYQQHQKFIDQINKNKEGEGDGSEAPSTEAANVNGNSTEVKVQEEIESADKENEEQMDEDPADSKAKRSRFADMTAEERLFVKEKENEGSEETEEKKRDASPEKRKEDDKSYKSRRSPSPEEDDSKSRRRRSSPSPRDKQRSRSPDHSRDRRDRRSRSRSHEDRYSSRKSRRSPSPRRRDYDDRQRFRYGDFRRENDFRRGNNRGGSPYGRDSRNRRQDLSPRSDYRNRQSQRDRSPSPRSRGYKGQQRDRSSSPRSNYRRTKERSPSPMQTKSQQREYSPSPRRSSAREKSPDESDYREKHRDASPKMADNRSSKQREASPPQRQPENPISRQRDRSPPEYRSTKQRDRTPSPEYRPSKQHEPSPGPRQMEYRSSKQHDLSPDPRSAEYRSSKQKERSISPEVVKPKPRERSVSPRSSRYPQKRRSPSPKIVEKPKTMPSPRARASPDARRTSRPVHDEKRTRKESSSSSSSSSDSSSSDESESDKSLETPEDERIKKEKREKLLMELKSIEESLEKQRTMKKKGKGGKESVRTEDRERSEDRQSYRSSRSEEERKNESRYDPRQRREEGSHSRMAPEMVERAYEERPKQEIPDVYLKSIEKYQKEFKSRQIDEPSKINQRGEYEQSYKPEEKGTRDRREARSEYSEPEYEGERRSTSVKRGSGDERGRHEDRRYPGEPKTMYEDDRKREQPDPRMRTEKRRPDPRMEKEESSDEEVVQPKQEPVRDRRRDSGSKYSDRSPPDDPRYDDRREVPKEKYKPERSESRRFSEKPREFEGNYADKKRDPAYQGYEDFPDKTRSEYERRPQAEYGERRTSEYGDRGPAEYEERRPADYENRRPDSGTRYEEKPKSRNEFNEGDRKRDWVEPPTEYEESPRKKERLDRPSRNSEYESYEGYHPESRSTSEKSYKIDPVDELDYYLNRKPKAAQGQVEKNGKWQTEPDQSPPDIRQSYYSPNPVEKEEEDRFDKKAKKKKKHRSRSPTSRDSKKKSKRSKRSPSEEESDDAGRYRRSNRSPVVEEFERRRSPSPRYRRTSSPEDQPYNNRAERYWRPPDHKLDEIHHYTDKKHKSASMTKDFPELHEIEKATRKSDNANDKEEMERKTSYGSNIDKEKSSEPDPLMKWEPVDPPVRPSDTTLMVKTTESNTKDTSEISTDKAVRKRPKIKRLPVPDTPPSDKSNQSDSQSESSYISDGEKSACNEQKVDQKLSNKKIEEEKIPEEIAEKSSSVKTKSGEIKSDSEKIHGLSSFMNIYEDSDDSRSSVKNNMEIPKTKEKNSNLSASSLDNSTVDVKMKLKEKESTQFEPTVSGVADAEDLRRRSIIADYSDSDENTNTSLKDNVTDTTQTRAEHDFLHISSKINDEKMKTTIESKTRKTVISASVKDNLEVSVSNEEQSSKKIDDQQANASKLDASNDAIKLQYKRTRYGIRLRSKESENKNKTGVDVKFDSKVKKSMAVEDDSQKVGTSSLDKVTSEIDQIHKQDDQQVERSPRKNEQKRYLPESASQSFKTDKTRHETDEKNRKESSYSSESDKRKEKSDRPRSPERSRRRSNSPEVDTYRERRRDESSEISPERRRRRSIRRDESPEVSPDSRGRRSIRRDETSEMSPERRRRSIKRDESPEISPERHSKRSLRRDESPEISPERHSRRSLRRDESPEVSPEKHSRRSLRRDESPEISPGRHSRRSKKKKKSSRHEYSPDRHVSQKGDRRSREREQSYRSSSERHSLEREQPYLSSSEKRSLEREQSYPSSSERHSLEREHSKTHTDKKEKAETLSARHTQFETSIELQSSDTKESSSDVSFKMGRSQVEEGKYDPGGTQKIQASEATIDKPKQQYSEDTELKMLETKETVRMQSTKSLEEPQQSGSSRWSLRSKASDSQDDSPRRTAKEDSPKPSTMTKRSRKSEDEDAQREVAEEKQAAKRRTRSSRSTEDFVDQKTPDVSIERQLSKRHKKSRKGEEISIENDPKLNSTLSVDLSSIALPGEGIRIKIFSEALSPTGNRKSPKVSPFKKVHADSLTDLRLEEIILPDATLRQEKLGLGDNSRVSSEVKKAEEVKASVEIQPEIQITPMPVQPPRKEYPIRSQKTAFSFNTSKKLPDDKRPLVKFGLPKSSNPNKLWEDEEDVDFTDKLLGKRIVDEPCDTQAPQQATTLETTSPPQMSEARTSPEKSVDQPTTEIVKMKERSVTPEKLVVKEDDSSIKKADNSFTKKADDSFTRKADDVFTKKEDNSYTKKADDSFTRKVDDSLTTSKADDSFTRKADDSFTRKADDSFIRKADDSFTSKADDSFKKKADDSFTRKTDDSFISTSSDDPDISFKTPSLVIKSKPVERRVDSPEKAPLIVAAPETPVLSPWNKTEEGNKVVEKPVESIDATTTTVQSSSDTKKQEKSSRRSKSRWDPPVAVPVSLPIVEPLTVPVAIDLYDPLQPTAEDLYDPFMPTDDDTSQKSKSQDDDQVSQVEASNSIEDLYDPTQPTDLEADSKKSLEIKEVEITMANSEIKLQQEEVAEKNQVSVEKKLDDEHSTHEVIKEEQSQMDKVSDEQELLPESSSNPSSENLLKRLEVELASPKPNKTSILEIEKSSDSQEEESSELSSDSMPVQSSSDVDVKSLDEDSADDSLELSEAEYIARQIIKMSKTAQMPRIESTSMVTKVSDENMNENNEKLEEKLEESCGMIEIAPEDLSPSAETKSVLLTSKVLQLPSAEKIAEKKSQKKDSSEEGEILSEADEKRDHDVGMAIETVVYGKGQKQVKKFGEVSNVKVKVEPDTSAGQGQVIESIITTRGKPKVEHVIAVAKSKEDKGEKAAKSEDAEDKVRKAQTEEALKLLEQYKGFDTKNEEALKMIEKFRSVDKELKTYNLDKPRSKKEGWERESYKERYEESKYRESNRYKDKDYKEKDYDRHSKDKDYEDRYSKGRHDDRYKSFDKRRDKFWDKRRRDSSERFEKYERKRHKKERYHDRRDRSYSRSHSRSPDRSKSRNSRSRSRDRSKEKSRRRSRERSRSRDRSRSQDRGRKSKRSRRDKRRYSSDESDDSSSSRSTRKEKEAYIDSSKGEVDKLTEEWIRMATEKPKKTKGQTSATVSSTASATMSSTSVTSQSGTAPPYYQATTSQSGAPPQYYQDAYGNYYPVTSTSQGYSGYQGMPPPQQGHEQNIPGIMPPHHTAPPPGMPQQPIPATGMPPPGMPPQHSMPPPGHMMPQYQQPNPQMYGQQQGYGQSEKLYDQSMYGHQPQPGPLGNQPPTFQAAGAHPTALPPPGLLPTPAAQFGLPQEYSTPGLIQPQRPPLIGKGPAIVQPVASPKLPFAGGLQGTRLPFPMPTQQTIPTFKPMEQKQSPVPASPLYEAGQSPSQLTRPKPMAVLQQKLLVTASPQDVSQSPSQLPRTDSPVVTSSSKDYQLPELPYQEAIQQEIKVEEVKPTEIKPLMSKPQMAMKGFKIKQKGLSLVMPTEDVVSSSFQSDTEEKMKKLSELSETENATPSPVSDLPKHPPPSSKTGLPIKLGMKQDKRDVDLSSPPPSASPRPEKVKSRWRRLSDFETPITQSPDSNMTDVPASSGSEASPMKELGTSEVAQVKQAVYDAWDPASDLIITPEAMKPQPAFKAKKEPAQKREKKEKTKDTDSPLKTDKVKETDSPLKVKETKEPEEEVDPNKIPTFELLDENMYLHEKKKSKKMKRMLCDCTITDEEKKCNVDACGEDCLNRMLYIECGSRCQCGEFCTNKRFQKRQFADVDAFRTDWKGFGLKTNAELPHGDFVMEYVGEVLDYKTFKSRTKQYAKSGESHFYFMALNADEVIDASYKGNVSRFINHSCDPNCETQKWTVNGVLRVGFFTKKEIPADTELTFDYQFETYGKEAQKCFCGTEKCRGTIGINKSTPLKSKKKPAEQEEDKEDLFQEEDIEEELDTLSEQGLHNKTDVLNLCRLMVRSEETQFRIKILKIIQECSDRNCLRLFLDYHGLELLWTWMADKTEECQQLKVQILTILKDLPINTKNMLKDSKILSLVQRWAGREEGEELQPCQAVPPPPVPTEMPISILASSKETRQLKKRVRFPDEASSDDNESRTSASDNFSEYTTNELYTDFEGKTGAGNDQVSEAEAMEGHQSSDIDSTSDDSKSREQPVQSPADSSTSTGDVESVAADSSSALEEIKYIEPRPDPMDEVAILADDLLVNWSDLKELFRIPKKQQVEERKRHEKELDKSDVTVKNEKRIEQMEKDQDRFRHLAAGWDTRKKKKRPPPPPPPEDDDFSDRPRKVLLPTPPKISKEERRQIFEAQVKAQEEMAEIERQQREAYLQQFYSDPNNYMYYGQDPNCPLPQGFQVQPGVEGGMEQYIDPNTGQAIPYEVIQAYIAQQQALQQPQAGYTDEALQQQLMSQQVQEQMLAQQALAGYAQPTPDMLYQQPEQASGESQAFLQQVQQLQQQLEMQGQLAGMGTSEEEDIPPPPSPPKSKAPKLPPNWKSAKDAEGKTYYYHTTTRQTQWSPPDMDDDDDYMSIIQDDMDIDTPPDDGKSGRKKTTTAAADTSTETAKKIKDQFRQKMSSYIVICLNPFRKPDCKSGRITSTDDFKHLARKLTHHVMSKELKHCRHVEDLEVNENVKSKAKDYVKKYMGKFGMIYRKSASPDD
ncbi:uncharacterized protein LOC143059261 isoform X2 [Mytilus galloprovincialis]|uniref:uncharacterized protein LOC143059261 isoform X2 n=1 Tax=Mytilus galloprovincialis TaxID=29158 RepID=UPI003F7C0849